MFANVGWGEMLVLVIAGLVILGPERLPGAIRWTSSALRQARDYISGATSQLREDLGPEFEDLREPLSELNKLRGMTPRAASRQRRTQINVLQEALSRESRSGDALGGVGVERRGGRRLGRREGLRRLRGHWLLFRLVELSREDRIVAVE